MRSSVDAAAFYKAMTALMDIPAKSPVKVLQEIKVEFTADHCTLSATNFNTWLSVTIPASGDDFAFVFWNSAGVQKVCRYFTGQLELELSGQRKSQIITMRCGDKGGKFPVYEAEECPTWPEFEAKQSYTANAANILKCVKQVKYAVDLRSTRPEYQGVLFQSKHIIALPAVMTAGWTLKSRFLSAFRHWNSSRRLAMRICRSAWQITGSCSRTNTFGCLRNVSRMSRLSPMRALFRRSGMRNSASIGRTSCRP